MVSIGQIGTKVQKEDEAKAYNTRDSLVVTDPTTNLALTGLSMGERTGSRVFQWVWSYVTDFVGICSYPGLAQPIREEDGTNVPALNPYEVISVFFSF